MTTQAIQQKLSDSKSARWTAKHHRELHDDVWLLLY